MARHRGILLAVVMLAVFATGAFVWLWIDPILPPPGVCNRDQLVRWLLRDLSAQPSEVRDSLVDRLQEELLAGQFAEIDWNGAGQQMPASMVARVNANAELLKRTWFERRAAEYVPVPFAQRCEFLDRQIGVLFRWLEIDERLFAEARKSGAMTQGATAGQFFDQIDGWMGEAQGRAHDDMVTGVNDAVLRWLATKSLEGQSPDVVRELALHIAHDLEGATIDGGFRLPLSSAEQQQLAANGERMMESWFGEQAQRFAGLPKPDRPAFLDKLIDLLQTASRLPAFSGDPASTAGGGKSIEAGAALMKFVRLTNEWTARAGTEDRPKLDELSQALRGRMVWKTMGSLFSLPKKK